MRFSAAPIPQRFKAAAFAAMALLWVGLAQAQVGGQPGRSLQGSDRDIIGLRFNGESVEQDSTAGEFTWLRGIYSNYSGGARGFGWRGGWWDTDFPDSDENFLRGVQRYTNIQASTAGRESISLTDPALYEHTFLYMNWKRVPIGSTFSGPDFSPEEIEALREFMFRGGFVMVDDFWGEAHYEDMVREITKIFPDRELVQLDTNHEIFHTFFDIDQLVQVPGRMVTWNMPSYFQLDDPNFPPAVYAILDDDGRVMMVANFNTDLGDGWEHTFYKPFPTKYSNEAYKIAINYLIYAFSH